MRFAYYQRLSPARRRIYDRSDAIHELPLPAGLACAPLAAQIREALAAEKRAAVATASQALLDLLAGAFAVPPLRVKVHAVRPRHSWGELHGLYDPGGPGRPTVSVWMRTAQQRRVVAFRSFVRTLLHELCHHLDYELFKLAETFHTEGFYRRESNLLRQVLQEREG